MTPPTDARLLLSTRKGNEAAARELWRRHAGPLHAYARSILRDASAAEDVVQEVFCRVMTLDRATLCRVRDGRAWLVQLVRRESLNRLRGERRERARRKLARPPAGARVVTAEERLRQALAQLPRHQREVVVLKHAGGLSFTEIALAIDSKRETAAARYRRAIEALRQTLEPETSTAAEEAHHV